MSDLRAASGLNLQRFPFFFSFVWFCFFLMSRCIVSCFRIKPSDSSMAFDLQKHHLLELSPFGISSMVCFFGFFERKAFLPSGMTENFQNILSY